jgi:flavin-dependent dehydrogenase
MYFFPGGYCGLAPIEDGLYNACCLVHRSLVGRARRLVDLAAWLKVVARHPALEARLRSATQVSSTIAAAPLQPTRRQPTCDGALLVGDAAGFLDPFTGDGVSMALHSGRLAARTVASVHVRGARAESGIDTQYQFELGRAVRRSYWIAGVLRALVRAPAGVQEAAAAMLPWLGAHLVAHTRWQCPLAVRSGSQLCEEKP